MSDILRDVVPLNLKFLLRVIVCRFVKDLEVRGEFNDVVYLRASKLR